MYEGFKGLSNVMGGGFNHYASKNKGGGGEKLEMGFSQS